VTRVVFAVGHDETPEAFWRVLAPARALGQKAVVLHDGRETDAANTPAHTRSQIRASLDAAAELAAGAETLWVHHPTSERALDVVRRAKEAGAQVVIDLSEDPHLRSVYGIGPAHTTARLECLDQALEMADRVVVATPGLLQAYVDYDVRLVRPAIILEDSWTVKEPEDPQMLLWWSDGRQKTGWADIAPEVQEVLLEEQDLRLRCVQFAHLHPLVDGLDSKAAGTLSGRFEVVLEGSLSVDENAHLLRRSAVGCYVALESYPVGDYAQSVSDLPILRVAALGIPTITTRPDPPPGALHAEPGEWTKTILSLLHQPDHRAELSARARRWAESRSTIAEYTRVLEEV